MFVLKLSGIQNQLIPIFFLIKPPIWIFLFIKININKETVTINKRSQLWHGFKK